MGRLQVCHPFQVDARHIQGIHHPLRHIPGGEHHSQVVAHPLIQPVLSEGRPYSPRQPLPRGGVQAGVTQCELVC
jgi:hypothetical protein